MNDQQLRIVLESIWKGEGADKAAASLKQVNQGADKAQSAMQKFNAGLKVVESTMVALGAAGAVFKTAFDMAEAGAQIRLAQERFENLAASIGASSAEILAGITDVTGGMLTQAQAIESANQIINLGLADTGQEVVDLAGLVANLGWDMQTVIMTFANDSKMRLDALGLSVTDVEARMKKFQAAGHSASEAFDLAVIDAGQAKLELLGSAADSSAGSWARFRVQVAEITDSFKTMLADGLTPVVSYITGSYAQSITEVAEGQLAAAQSGEQLIDVLTRQLEVYRAAGNGGLFLTNMEEAVAQSMVNTMSAIAQSSDSLEEFTAALQEAGVNADLVRHYVYVATGVVGQSAEVFYRHQRAVLADAQELQRHMAITKQNSAAQENFGISLATATDRLAYAALVARDAGQAGDAYEVTAADIAAAELRRAEAHEQAAVATVAAAAATEQLQATLDNIAAGTLQNQIGLIEQLYQAQADYSTALGILENPWDDNAAAAEDAAGRVTTATQEMATAYKQMVLDMMIADAGGVFTAEAAEFATAVGLMSEAEANARMRAQDLITEQEKLFGLWQEGKISAEELAIASGLLADGVANSADAALKASGAFDDAYGKANNLRDALLVLEGDHQITVTTTWQEVGGPPQIPAGGTMGNGTGANQGNAMAEGGWVAGGVPGRDSVNAWLMPGERVLSVREVVAMGGPSAIDQWAGGNGNPITNNNLNTHVTVVLPNVRNQRDAYLIADAIVQQERRAEMRAGRGG